MNMSTSKGKRCELHASHRISEIPLTLETLHSYSHTLELDRNSNGFILMSK